MTRHSHSRTDHAEHWDHEAAAYMHGRVASAVDAATLALAPPCGEVLELGAGPGVFTRQLLGLPLRRLVATDLAPAFVAELRALSVPAGVELLVLQADHRALSLPGASFDVIYAMATLHHLREADRAAVFADVARWLRPGGRFALVEDWAFTPEGRVETELLALRAALRAAEDPGEVHWGEARWIAETEAAGLRLAARAQAPRPEHLGRFRGLGGNAAAGLAWLEAHAPHPQIPMSILVFTR